MFFCIPNQLFPNWMRIQITARYEGKKVAIGKLERNFSGREAFALLSIAIHNYMYIYQKSTEKSDSKWFIHIDMGWSAVEKDTEQRASASQDACRSIVESDLVQRH